MMILQKLYQKALIEPPKWLPKNTCWLVDYGSRAHGTSNYNSDYDMFGIVIPPAEYVFQNIPNQISFQEWRHHKVIYDNKAYDINILSLGRYIDICINIDPQYIGSFFVKPQFTYYADTVGRYILDNKHLFLSKETALNLYQSSYKILDIIPHENDDYITDYAGIKRVYSIFRMLNEAEQIVSIGTLDIEQASHMVQDAKRGTWTKNKLKKWMIQKKEIFDSINCICPNFINRDKVMQFILECYRLHFGCSNLALMKPKQYLAKWFI